MAAIVTRDVRVEEEEEDHAQSHEVHVDAEEDAGVVEAPAALDAADGVNGAKDGEQGGKKDEEIGTAVGEAGEQDGGEKREEYEQIGAKKRVTAEIEEYRAVVPDGVRRRHARRVRLHAFKDRRVAALALWVRRRGGWSGGRRWRRGR